MTKRHSSSAINKKLKKTNRYKIKIGSHKVNGWVNSVYSFVNGERSLINMQFYSNLVKAFFRKGNKK